MDCLYRTSVGWFLVDFKSDELRSQAALETAVEIYTLQLLRYRQAAYEMLSQFPISRMCFLNANRITEVREIEVRISTQPTINFKQKGQNPKDS